jgi:putative hydrolase of the HAD superfamily
LRKKENALESLSISLPFDTKAILFDLDDTLYDRNQAYFNWGCSFARKYFSDASDSQRLAIINTLIHLDKHEDAPRDELFAEFKRSYPLSHLSVPALVDEYYRDFPRCIQPMKEALELLYALREMNIPFGIITNGTSYQLSKIQLLGLDQLTSCIFVSKIFGKEKPDAAIFLAAARHLQIYPEEILFVGDNPYNDIWGAHRAGMRTVWLQRTHPWPLTLEAGLADMTFQSLNALIMFMRTI